MKRRYSELTEEAKASYGTSENTSDDTWLYCTNCERAMRQGDCVIGEGENLRCAYDDCASQDNLAFQSLYGWDAYRQGLGHEAVQWPDEPEPGKRYTGAGAAP